MNNYVRHVTRTSNRLGDTLELAGLYEKNKRRDATNQTLSLHLVSFIYETKEFTEPFCVYLLKSYILKMGYGENIVGVMRVIESYNRMRK